jgi:hypothetical protein
MSSISTIVVPEVLTPHEEAEIAALFALPVVKKYLRTMGVNDSSELLALNVLDMTDSSIATRHHFVSGKLAVYATLLSIQPPTS